MPWPTAPRVWMPNVASSTNVPDIPFSANVPDIPSSNVPDIPSSNVPNVPSSANVPNIPLKVPSNAAALDSSGNDSHVAYFVGDDVSSLIEDDMAIKRKGDTVSVTGSVVEPIIKRQKSGDEDEHQVAN